MNLVCINCPRGCHLIVQKVHDEIIVSGNACYRGKEYGINEMTNPLRTVTSTVEIISKSHKRLPVITSSPIPKEKMMDVMKELKGISVKAPIKINDVIVHNILNLNVDIIASRTIDD